MGHVGADFGGLLKAMREARRISQSKLAERADFDHSYVSRLESGARMPTRDAVERLASALTLAQSEEDGLLAAAGFLPRAVSVVLSHAPGLWEVLHPPKRYAVPAEYRDNIRQVWRLLAEQARFAVRPL